MHMRWLLVLMVLLTGVAVLPLAARDGDFVIGVSIPSQDDGYFVQLLAGIEEAVDAAEVKLEVVDSKNDPAVEVKQIQELIDKGVNALLIYPLDPANLVTSIELANKAEIPVFLLGTPFDQTENDIQVISALAAADDKTGEKVGSYFCEATDEGKVVLILEALSATEVTTSEMVSDSPEAKQLKSQVEGLTAYIAENCPSVSVVVQDTETYASSDSVDFFTDEVEAGQQIGGVFAPNAALIDSLLDVTRTKRLYGIDFVTLEVTPDTLGALEARKLARIVFPEPKAMGKLGLETALAYLKGEQVDPVIDVDLALIDADTASDYRFCLNPNGCP